MSALERDLLPWRRTWSTSSTGRHSNVVSKKPYSGVNPILLEMHTQKHSLQSPWWATFNQWKRLGCVIRRRPADVEPGEWGCGIVVYLPVTKEVEDPITGDDEKETYWLLKKFVLFNAEQVEGFRSEKYQPSGNSVATEPDFAPAEELIAKTGAKIRHGGDRAFYQLPTPVGSFPHHTDGDFIQVPHKSNFRNGGYYPTMLHELGHWSEVRLGWDREKHGYPMGELVAEIASCYLAGELGIPNGEQLENHASYIKSWLESMRNNPNFVFQAGKQASKVTDFLLSFVRQPETTKPELVEA